MKYSNRPYSNPNDMDKDLIEKWNSRVDEKDIVWQLGDFAFAKTKEDIARIAKQLNGQIYLVTGNHDRVIENNTIWFLRNKVFHNIFSHYIERSFHGRDFTLCHYAMRVWNKSHYGAYHLYGHSHGSLEDDKTALSFDCGVDCHEYAPINFDEVRAIMDTKEWEPIDHHRGNPGVDS